MDLKRYLKDSSEFSDVARANEIVAAQAILKAAEIKRDELRQANETNPGDDVMFKQGQIKSLNWILDLPRKANDYIESIGE